MTADAAAGTHMGEGLSALLPVVLMLSGLALIVYAAYLQYMALSDEQTRRHVTMRAVLAAAGIALILVGRSFLQ